MIEAIKDTKEQSIKFIENVIDKSKNNIILQIVDIKNLTTEELLTEDDNGLNVLDWAVMNHHFDNIKLLLDYIDLNECQTNCFIILFCDTFVEDPNKENIKNKTILLLDQKCDIPSSDELESIYPCLDPIYIIDAIIAIDTTRHTSATKIEAALLIAKKNNQKLTVKNLKGILKSDLLKTGRDTLNLLDWAIANHNFSNIKLLLNYIDPNKCEINCFIRLFRGVIGKKPNKENITEITKLLLKIGCNIPYSDDLDNINPCLNYCYIIDAKIAINAVRPKPEEIKRNNYGDSNQVFLDKKCTDQSAILETETNPSDKLYRKSNGSRTFSIT